MPRAFNEISGILKYRTGEREFLAKDHWDIENNYIFMATTVMKTVLKATEIIFMDV
jgi:hypothetical protein